MKLNADLSPMRLLPGVALAALLLAACSTVDEAASRLFSSNTDAAGVIAGRVMLGRANFTSAHEATIRLQSDDAPGLSCFGSLRFTATSGGVAGFLCSDGVAVSMPFRAISALRGAGRGQIGDNMVALTYGLEPDIAAAYLGLPAGRLVRTAAGTSAAGSSEQAGGRRLAARP